MPTKSNMWDLFTPLPLIPIYSILVDSSYFCMCVLPYWVISSWKIGCFHPALYSPVPNSDTCTTQANVLSVKAYL